MRGEQNTSQSVPTGKRRLTLREQAETPVFPEAIRHTITDTTLLIFTS